MLSRKEIERIIKQNKPLLQEKYKVKEIGIFGSYAKGLGTKESDIDILVAFNEPIGLEFIELKEYLEFILGKKVDLVTEGALKPQIKEKILSEVLYQ